MSSYTRKFNLPRLFFETIAFRCTRPRRTACRGIADGEIPSRSLSPNRMIRRIRLSGGVRLPISLQILRLSVFARALAISIRAIMIKYMDFFADGGIEFFFYEDLR